MTSRKNPGSTRWIWTRRQPITIVGTQVVRPELPTAPPGAPSTVAGAAGGVPTPSVPGPVAAGGGGGNWGDAAPPAKSPLPDWGTYVPPDEAAKSGGGGEVGKLGKALEQFLPHNPNDPDNTA
jgi:hypothetical protein